MFRELTEAEADDFRRWAQENYKPGDPIDPLWHPVVREECESLNREADEEAEDARVTCEGFEPEGWREGQPEFNGAFR
jgi:hypothetical protein